MSLKNATVNGELIQWPGDGPQDPDALLPYVGKPLVFECTDSWINQRGDAAHTYLDSARTAWTEYPEYMDFLDESSPVFGLKAAERDLVLHWWKPWLFGNNVLDIGCGVGRFTVPFLQRGATVTGLDADALSLRRCAWHAAGKPGKIELLHQSVHKLPEGPFDVIIAAEVLCYVPELDKVMSEVVARLAKGGTLLLSMEARWGWATAADAPVGALESALSGDGVVYMPGERYVRTFTEQGLRELLERHGLVVDRMVGSHWLLDGPLEDVAPDTGSLQELLALEDRCRNHPVWGPLNRLWLVAATKPEQP